MDDLAGGIVKQKGELNTVPGHAEAVFILPIERFFALRRLGRSGVEEQTPFTGYVRAVRNLL